MAHKRERSKQFFRKITGRRKHPHIPPTAPSANITPIDSSAADINHIQQEQSRDSFPSTPPASHQQSPAEKSLWDRAYDALAKENPRLVEDYDELLAREQMSSSTPDETTPSPLQAPHGVDTRSDRSRRLDTVIQNGLKRMEDNKTTFRIAGHEIVLADQITTAVNFLVWGKEWVDTAVRASPEASLVWSGVCLILPLLTNPTAADEANRDGFVYVTSRLRYYVALEPMLRRLGQNARVDEALVSAANDHIVDLYHAILDFQLSSVLRFYQSRFKTHVRDIVPSRDWEQTRLDIKTLEDTVNGDLGQINQIAARQELEYLNKTSEDTHATMESMLSVATQQLTVSKEQLAAQLAAQEDSKREKLLAKQQKCLQAFWLTQNGKGATYDWYKDRVESRVEGTCKWFLQHEYFRKWLSQESGPLLVSADPGCGKSVLAKYLIDDELAKQSATTCYFFFKDQDQNTVRQALCALLHQLFRQKSALISHAMELYDDMGAAFVQSESMLWTILRDAVRDPQAGPVIFVIDALDECDESQLSSLIRNLEDMFRGQQLANAKFKVLMTSRPYQQVVTEFYSLQDAFRQIHIPGEEEFEAISHEINCVIQHRVKQLAQKHRLSDDIKSSLNSKLLATEHRTYLWVYLVFDYLDKGFNKGFKKTDEGIDAAVQTLPTTVNQAYDQILNRSQDDETVNTVKKALSIILAARRPLTLSEMNIALSLDGRGRGQSIYDLDLEQDVDFKFRLRALCGLFVNVHHDKIYFLHQTAREFLLQSSTPTTILSNLQWHHSITARHAHSVLAEVCMFYLDMLNSTDAEAFRDDEHHDALYDYSIDYWGSHVREAEYEKGSAMVDLASRLCTPDPTSNSIWASIMRCYCIRPECTTNVLAAADLGLTPVAELLLSRHADIDAKNDQGSTALMLAVRSGNEAISRLMLGYGADIDAKNVYGYTALMIAAASGNEAILRLMLGYGADVEAKNGYGWTALMIAVVYGREAVIRLLLENRVDIEAGDDDGTTALMRAATSGDEAVIRLLLDHGADVEARRNDGWTSLMLAAEVGYEAGARLLLKSGADIEAMGDDGRTALMIAIAHDHKAATLVLLSHGANVAARDSEGLTALMIAARSFNEAATQLLLDYGADVEARKDNGATVLMLATTSGDDIVIQLLLENGADVDAKDDDGLTALMLAATSGDDYVMQMLLDHGADIEARRNDGWTSLMLAARCGYEAATWQLLEDSADVEARNDDGATALILAAISGDDAVIRLLLEYGADIEASNDDGLTALMLATRHGHKAVIQLLLDNGANVDAKDNNGWTALSHAPEVTTQVLAVNVAPVEAE